MNGRAAALLGFALASLVLAFAGCQKGTAGAQTSEDEACDPLAAPSTALTNFLGAGSGSDGTIYVVDLPVPSTPRVFVVQGKSLVRQRIEGSGTEAVNGGTDYTLSFGAPPQSLQVQVTAGGGASMALGPADAKSFTGGTPLTPVSVNQVNALPIVNLPAVVEYVADVSNGDVLVLALPTDYTSTADYRLYFGPTTAVAQRSIESFNQALSGYPTVSFVVDGAAYTMQIPVVYGPDASPLGEPGPGTLTTPGGTLGLTLRSGTPSLAGMSFTCAVFY